MSYWKLVSIVTLLFIAVACSSDNGDAPDQPLNDSFNREAMLMNWADNIIVPAYTSFVSKTTELNAATTVFTETPSEENLIALRTIWVSTYREFQNVSMFEIGKAEEVNFRNRMNIYPTNANKINDFIAEGTFNFSLPSTIDAQGFPALDYMLNGLAETDSEIVAFYTTNENAANYLEYLNALSETIETLSITVLNDWNENFRDSFVSNTSSSASGSVDKLANDYILYYEKALRAGKIGIPAGVFSNDPLPENVEAFYKKDISKSLAQQALTASQNFFNGTYFNSSQQGESFRTYLTFLNSVKNGEDLSGLINAQFETAKTNIEELNVNFVSQIETDNIQMQNTYDELQRNVIFLKVDMLQALDINVDYVDTDGD